MDTFFTKENCDRCGKELHGRTMSFFSEEAICMDCAKKESEVKAEMRRQGINPESYEGIGHVPDINLIA